jgi:anti-sigma B factor antagonist
MQIKIQRLTPTQAVLHPSGRIDVASSNTIRQFILDTIDSGIKYMVVDLQEVEFMDSSGLSVLVSGVKALRKMGGMLTICNANPQIRTALRLTMLDKVFPVYESVESAMIAAQIEDAAG